MTFLTEFSVFVLIAIASAQLNKNFSLHIEEKIAFTEFKDELNKNYSTRRDETKAFKNFKDSFELVKSHNEDFNLGNSTFQLSLNKFADEPAEFFIDRLNFDLAGEMDMRADDDYPIIPKCRLPFLNYSNDGFVNTVRNQGRCGACYAFAVTGACEGAFFKKYNKLYKISEQQLVDCTRSDDYGNRGCLGGKVTTTYTYLASQMAMSDTNYPYKAKETDNCGYNEAVGIGKIDNYLKLSNVNESYLQDLLCFYGPLTVSFDASSMNFQYYSSGVYFDTSCKSFVNHAMVLVGYGTDPEFGPYWLLKNSYGKNWGERGFFRLARGKGNLCGFLDQITICVLDDKK